MVKKILDIINYDICGPMTPQSLGVHIYYVTFIDDNSRKTQVYNEIQEWVITKFQEFKVEVENLIERRIMILRSNNGAEYTSKEIIALCKESGIKSELIVPYNPEKMELKNERTNPLKKV